MTADTDREIATWLAVLDDLSDNVTLEASERYACLQIAKHLRLRPLSVPDDEIARESDRAIAHGDINEQAQPYVAGKAEPIPDDEIAEKWTVERHDDDEGEITYEVWDATKQRRICTAETRELARFIAKAPSALAALKSQLPAGMQHCTIQFKECELGHGWLTATNWVQHGCPTCAIHALKSRDSDVRREERERCATVADHFAADAIARGSLSQRVMALTISEAIRALSPSQEGNSNG